MNILQVASLLIELEADVSSGALGEGAIEVGCLGAILGLPGHALFVGDDTSDEGRSVVTTETDEHDSEFGHALVCLDRLLLHHWARGLLVLVVQSESVLVGDSDVVLSLSADHSGVDSLGDGLEGELTGSCGVGNNLLGFDHLKEIYFRVFLFMINITSAIGLLIMIFLESSLLRTIHLNMKNLNL